MSSDRYLRDIAAKAVPTTFVEFSATISRTESATTNYLVAGLEIHNALFVHAETGNLALVFKMRTALDNEVQLNCRARFYGDDGTTVGSSTLDMKFNKTQTEQPHHDVITKEALQGVVKLKVELLLTCNVTLTTGALVMETVRVASDASSTPTVIQKQHIQRAFPGFFKNHQPEADVYMWPNYAPEGSLDQLVLYLNEHVIPDVPLKSFNEMYDLLEALEAELLSQHVVNQALEQMRSEDTVLTLLEVVDYRHQAAARYLKPVVLERVAAEMDAVLGALGTHLVRDTQGLVREAHIKYFTKRV
ncbi:hypothetical protein BGZ70_004674 [Mortierella alpina]|uniref:Uncharacterized protein n=1 Tax=Mortierella alpina TaxID=64518 RepID=A0A9P6LVE9_MORAP|nr:hypothetical protein BGZ70_004674 [Mortierella alpina]